MFLESEVVISIDRIVIAVIIGTRNKIMRVRTSVTLPKELLVKVDALAGKKNGRSAVVESALVEYVEKATPRKRKLNQRDIDIINANAEKLNKEALDVLEYQRVNW